MPVTILTSIQDDFRYHYNLARLRMGLQNRRIRFINAAVPQLEQIQFNDKGRVYDFTRSAKARVREDMTTQLNHVLPGLEEEDRRRIREAFDCLFNYFSYKGYLNQVNQHRTEYMNILIFKEAQQLAQQPAQQPAQRYVAHVYFNVTSRRTDLRNYTVQPALTCHRYSHFPLDEIDLEAFLQEIVNLHVHEPPEEVQEGPN